jgi:hypothetical protein
MFRAVRRQSTVALAGESADEVVGRYRDFFDADAIARTPSGGWQVG